MKTFLALALLLPFAAEAALPPRYQNLDDLRALVAFVEGHPVVAESLRAIDLEHRTIHFGDGCRALFKRQPIEEPKPGPAGPLLFDRGTCPVE